MPIYRLSIIFSIISPTPKYSPVHSVQLICRPFVAQCIPVQPANRHPVTTSPFQKPHSLLCLVSIIFHLLKYLLRDKCQGDRAFYNCAQRYKVGCCFNFPFFAGWWFNFFINPFFAGWLVVQLLLSCSSHSHICRT